MKARESKEYQRNRKRPGSRAKRSRKRTEEAVLGSICEAAEARKVRLNLGMLVELHGGKIKMSLFQFQRDRQAVLSGKAGEKNVCDAHSGYGSEQGRGQTAS